LHKCEEERHEFDFHLEIMSKTISALENINMKIQQMSNEEKSTFKLKPGLGLPNKSIYQRIIKKVYGKEPGMEVVATLHDCPAIAVPIVLSRLKAKDEDWRRAQREWNKVWREVDARNFYKSLDHQGVTFKSTDKKAMTSKTLVAAIEAARDEQIFERAKLVDPSLSRTKPTYQLAYQMTDLAVMKDTTKLILSYLDRLGANYSLAEREKIEKWLVDFLVVFFMLDHADFEESVKGSPHGHEAAAAVGALGVSNMVPVDAGGLSMELDPAADGDSALASGRRTPNRKGKGTNGAGVNSTDLRKSLLSRTASGIAGGSRSQSARASPTGAIADLPTVVASEVNIKNEDSMPVDSVWISTQPEPDQVPTSSLRASASRTERKATFFGNTIAYVVLRIFQVKFTLSTPLLLTTAR
jgi:paired amphipathic helix protein Sin3a